MKYKSRLHKRKLWLVVECKNHYWEAFTSAGDDAVKFHGLYKFRRHRLKHDFTDNTGILSASDPYTRTCWLEMALLHPGLKRGKR